MQTILFASVALAAVGLGAVPAAAQEPAQSEASFEVLEARLQEQEQSVASRIERKRAELAELEQTQQALDSIRQQLDELKVQSGISQSVATAAAAPPIAPPSAPVEGPAAKQAAANATASANGTGRTQPDGGSATEADRAPTGPKAAIANAPQLSPSAFKSQPRPAAGGSFVAPQFQFGSSERASIAVEIPLIYWGNPCGNRLASADCGTSRDKPPIPKVRPSVFAVTAGVSTNLSEGEGVLFKREDDDDFDYLSGTSFKVGFERYGFAPREFKDIRDEATDYIIATLRPKCEALHGFDSPQCTGQNLVDFVFAPDKDGKLTYAKEIDAISNLYWRAPKKTDRTWGYGGSVSYSSVDYSFVDGFVQPVTNADGKTELQPVLTAMLPDAKTDTRDNWLFELHAYRLIDLPVLGSPMLTAQVQRKEQFTFREGAERTICNDQVGPDFTVQKCDKRNLEAPMYNPQTILSVGPRWKFEGLPVDLAFAPQWRYVLESNQRVWDFPIFLGSDDKLNGGVRLRLKRGGMDLLDNDLPDEDLISIFFTPFTFHGF